MDTLKRLKAIIASAKSEKDTSVPLDLLLSLQSYIEITQDVLGEIRNESDMTLAPLGREEQAIKKIHALTFIREV